MNNKVLGKITVYSVKGSLDGEPMEGMKINLYRINGISPCLEESKITDKNGVVEFLNITDGNYRIIEIIDKSVYKKPSYYKWNEVNISKYSREETIYIINNIRN